MRKQILTAAGFLCLAGGTWLLTAAWGQDKRRDAAEDDGAPHRIGVIDVDYVFENYEKVKVEIEGLKAELQSQDELIKGMQKRGQEMSEELKTLKEGTPEYKTKFEKVLQYQAQFDAKRKHFQVDFKREQAKMQLTIYQEIQDAVKSVANYNKLTLVVKVTRNEAGSTSDPTRTQIMMSQAVMFHRPQDDMSDMVKDLLNKRYNRDAGNVRPVGGEEPSGKKKTSKVKTAGGSKSAE
ncbi:MAG: OmpH family outer membrane protein [Planctomycetia bacterium]|nr:OmpH family outer membrane protein [Planctomycetia bacterium]